MAQSLVKGQYTGWQASPAAIRAQPIRTLQPQGTGAADWQRTLTSRAPPTHGTTYTLGAGTPQRPANQGLYDRASAARIRSPNGLSTVNPNWEQAGSSARGTSVTPPFGQWGTFGPDGRPITAATQPYVTAADTIARARSAATSGGSTQGGNAMPQFAGGGTQTMATGSSQFPMGGGMSMSGYQGGLPPGAFGALQNTGPAGGGGAYADLADYIASLSGTKPPAAPKPKPEPGTGPGWKDPRDPLTMMGGGYPADDVTHGNALIQQMLAENPRMPQRGDPSGKPGPKPPTAPKPGKGGGKKWWQK